MLTQDDIQKIIEAAKGNLATKEDLKTLATKEDLGVLDKRMATKDNLNALDKKMDDGFVILTKEIFSTKEEFEKFKDEIRESFSSLQTSVDAYAKRADSYFQEMVMLSHKIDRHERWMHQLAEKLGVKLEYA